MSRNADVQLAMPTADVLVGRAFFAVNRRGVSTTFRYDESYLAGRNGAFALDPALPLFTGQHAVAEVFGATEDWRQVATSNGIAERELTRMADAFDGLRGDLA